MQKTVTKKRTETIYVCDLCGKETAAGNRCYICQRSTCFRCRKLHFAGKPGDLVEFAIVVCDKCGSREVFVSAIEHTMECCNGALRNVVAAWKRGVKP